LRSVNAELQSQVDDLTARIVELVAENAKLAARVAELEHEASRHSGNSGKPPSSDTLTQRAAQNEERLSRAERRRRAREQAKKLSERGQPKRRPGKQPGDEGKTLQMRANPDEVVVHVPGECGRCGGDLADADVVATEARQVFDLPPTAVVVVEHQAQTRRCRCGATTKAAFPTQARAPVCYGPAVRALAAYVMARQHVPVERCAELLSDVLGIPVSTGFLAGVVPEAAGGLSGFLAHLKDLLRGSEVLHADETGARIAGLRRWFHTVATAALTLLECHTARGVKAYVDMDVLPKFSGTLVTDGYQSYWAIPEASFDHALCGAHLLRDLTEVIELGQREWASAMIEVLLDGRDAAEAAHAEGLDQIPAGKLKSLRRRYTLALQAGWAANPDLGRPRSFLERKPINLLKRLEAQREEVCRSWTKLSVPFSNNTSERSLRMAKLHDKISGCFRTFEGAAAFCALRSYIQTAAKQGVNRFDALVALFRGDPWMPFTPPPLRT
jgi:transposase